MTYAERQAEAARLGAIIKDAEAQLRALPDIAGEWESTPGRTAFFRDNPESEDYYLADVELTRGRWLWTTYFGDEGKEDTPEEAKAAADKSLTDNGVLLP